LYELKSPSTLMLPLASATAETASAVLLSSACR
jgi:hypothetical protein